ncbi:hypothetical protein IGI04_003168 [Brassica rapa subsp. trilocularis]|uniref:Uncharacterized protein n=1 Tax=Brassica rapa subsp. trilocularis TaxID=1813537 RepID=A0ABQ7NYC2_BRACM|nr:hypothetical protein IGI04_003168 [Brassica rapa subsp. trilocularis]
MIETKKRQLVVSDIVLIGEIGGTAEEDAAALIKESGTEKPVIVVLLDSLHHR